MATTANDRPDARTTGDRTLRHARTRRLGCPFGEELVPPRGDTAAQDRFPTAEHAPGSPSRSRWSTAARTRSCPVRRAGPTPLRRSARCARSRSTAPTTTTSCCSTEGSAVEQLAPPGWGSACAPRRAVRAPPGARDWSPCRRHGPVIQGRCQEEGDEGGCARGRHRRRAPTSGAPHGDQVMVTSTLMWWPDAERSNASATLSIGRVAVTMSAERTAPDCSSRMLSA